MSVCIPRSNVITIARSLTLETLGPVGPVILTVPIGGGLVGGLPAGTAGQVLSVDGSGNLVWVAPSAPSAHVLATTSGLGANHTVSGLTSGMVLIATSATTALFRLLAAGDIPAHPLTNHTVSGLTTGYVLTALSANTFGFAPSNLSAINNGAWTFWDSSLSKTDIRFRLPVVVASGGVIAEYASIQAAITAATSGQTVAIPPGSYTENLTLKGGVNVTEMISGTVTLNGTITTQSTTTATIVCIDSIIAFGNGSSAINSVVPAGGTCTVIARTLLASTVSGSCTGVKHTGAGDLVVYARSIVSSGPGSNIGIDCSAGTVLVLGSVISGTLYDLRRTGGTLNVGGGCNYSTTNGTITILPGSNGVTPGAGTWTTFSGGGINFAPSLPAIISPNSGVVTTYATIQSAINAAVSGDRVAIPPGLWDEEITLKNGVRVTELIPGTVVLVNSSGITAVIAVDGGYLQVDSIMIGTHGGTTVALSSLVNAQCTIIVHRILIDGAANGTAVVQNGAGTLNLWVDEIVGTNGNTNMTGVQAYSGVVNLYLRGGINAIGSTSASAISATTLFGGSTNVNVYGGTIQATTMALYNDPAGLAIVSVNGCFFDPASVSGSITFGAGDRASLAEAVKMPLMHQ